MQLSKDENIKDDAEKSAKVEQDGKPTKERRNRREKVKPLQKIVIRKLPPTMTEDEFLQQVAPLPDHDYFYFIPADWTLGQHASGRAYINFCRQEDIFIFKDKFDGYVFVDQRGIEYPAVVEFAPFQGLPKSKSRKNDNKSNTIETESHFLTFLETLKEAKDGEGKGESILHTFKLKDDSKAITSTPLLEYLANLKQERRDERKRKVEERKTRRDDEKQRKRTQVAKSIPKSIAEDAKEDDDGIIVTAIKSRPTDRDRNKNSREADRDRGKKPEGERPKSDRDKREAQRRDEKERKRDNRNARRQEERQRKREEQRKEGEQKNKTADNNQPVGGAKDPPPPKEEKEKEKEKVKKYSETRRERRSRNENSDRRDNRDRERGDAKNDLKSDKPKEKKETGPSGSAASNANKDQSCVADGGAGSRSNANVNVSSGGECARPREDRSARIIRNKDRPSLQIYQPGKRQFSTQRSTEDKSASKSSSSSTSPTMDEPPQLPPPPPSLSQPQTIERKDPPKQSVDKQTVKKLSDNRSQKTGPKQFTNNSRRSSLKDDGGKKQLAAVDDQKPSGDKKISRYSERRNRAKEKREAGSTASGGAEEQLENLSLAGRNDDADYRMEDKSTEASKPNWSEGDDKPFQHSDDK